jgi:hypothetical protein
MKNVKSVSELVELEVKPTDMIGFMYNSLRKDLVEMMDKPMEIRQFQGLLVGNTPTQPMLEESRLVFHAFAAGNNMLREVMDLKIALLKTAEAEFATAKENGQQESIKIARKAISKARAEVKVTEERHKDQSSNLISIVAAWGKGKTENRKAWAQAVHTIVCGGRGTGSILFHVFPQEAIDAIAERTNGIRVSVAQNNVAGVVFVKDNVFYMDSFNGGKAEPIFRYDMQKRKLAHVNSAVAVAC